MGSEQVLTVGAGVAGLSLARQIQGRGGLVTLLDKGRGVGGRCATRRVDDQPVDHGVPFLHGQTEAFVRAIEALDRPTMVHDWPMHLRGPGTPCQPQAFSSQGLRLAVSEGVSAFPKQLARGLNVELGTRVERIGLAGDHFEVQVQGEIQRRAAPSLVLTCPAEQTRELLAPLAESWEEVRAVTRVLEGVFMLPCLTVLAGYAEAPRQRWHLMLPEPGSAIHSLINDSSKRPPGATQTLVIQARSDFSRQHLEEETGVWTGTLLAAAAGLVGEWAGEPAWVQSHVWRFARVQRGNELGHPVLLRWPGGATLGLCGEAFNPLGGVEGAYLSGIELAFRMRTGTATEVNS